MKVYFTGSDVLLLNRFPKQTPFRKYPYILFYRFVVWLSKFCTEEYWCVHEHLLPELKKAGIKDVVIFQHPYNTTFYPKKKHTTFNILFYYPVSVKDKKLNEWLYGVDIYTRVKFHYRDDRRISFYEIDGSQDMSEVWPVVDFYLRCNRHDGGARLVDECKVQGIPYYWSTENPDFKEIITLIEIARK